MANILKNWLLTFSALGLNIQFGMSESDLIFREAEDPASEQQAPFKPLELIPPLAMFEYIGHGD